MPEVFKRILYHYERVIWSIIPLIMTIIMGLTYNLYAQQNKNIDSRASKEVVKQLCHEMDTKVDNETLRLMIKGLENKDSNLQDELNRHQEAIENQRIVQQQQLEALHGIQLEIRAMNNTFKGE